MFVCPLTGAAPSLAAGPDERVDSSVSRAKVLIVGDDRECRDRIARHLCEAGFGMIEAAETVAGGLDAARAWQPELVITAWPTSDRESLVLCSRMRADPRVSSIPVIVQADLRDPRDRLELFAAGVTDVITLSADRHELVNRVRNYIEQHRLVARLSEYQRRVDEDLRYASSMQESILPNALEVERLKLRYPMALSAYYAPSHGLGGDFWGAEAVDGHGLRLYSADFAGHGVAAALNTFRLHALISQISGEIRDPAAWLTYLNTALCDLLPTGQFATMFCGLFDFSTSTLTYAAAAAPSPLVLSGGVDAGFRNLDGTGFPLGVTRDATYQNHVVPFGPGSTLIQYSDALIETPSVENPAFTVETLCTFLDTLKDERDVDVYEKALLTELGRRSWLKPADDLTIVTLRHVGDER
jgi:sigma-B regulation protein RsbU (phosphoserine phosphatase)